MTSPTENEDLNLHVSICAQRYQNIRESYDNLSHRIDIVEHRIDNLVDKVDMRFNQVETTLEMINEKLSRNENSRNRQLITTAATVIVTLLAALGWAINRLI